MRIKMKNTSSNLTHQPMGVPQGSALSPILYITFTNSYKLKYSNFVQIASFADDIAFWMKPAIKDPLRRKILQKELDNFSNWSNKWKMYLNSKKCGSMSFSKSINLSNKYSESMDPITNKPILTSKYKINGSKLKYHKTERYLGIILDERLNFKAHIHHVKGKVAMQLSKLSYLINSGYDLSTHSLSILYKALARSSIEYGLIHYLPSDATNEIKKLQNKFLRLIVPSRLDTPCDQLQIITNIEPIATRYNYLIMRQLARIYHSDIYHPLSKTYKNYTNYLNKIMKGNYRPNNPNIPYNNKLKWLTKNSIFTAQNIAKHNTKMDIFTADYGKIKQTQVTANPTYNLHTLPTNCEIYTYETKPIHDPLIKHIKAYTDGSCFPNPGRGAASMHIPLQTHSRPEYNETYKYKYPITILTAELTAIAMILNYILINDINQIIFFQLFCDNKGAMLLIDGQQYPQYNHTKEIIENILIKLHQVQYKYPLMKIQIIKIKSHTHNENGPDFDGNAKADTLANTAAKSIKLQRKRLRHTSYTTTVTQIHKFCHSHWVNLWKDKPLSWTNNLMKTNIIKINKKIYNITKLINTHQLAIISSLMTRHIELNKFLCL